MRRGYFSSRLGPRLANQWMLAPAVWRSGKDARCTCTEVPQHTATNVLTIAQCLPMCVQTTPADKAMRVEITPTPQAGSAGVQIWPSSRPADQWFKPVDRPPLPRPSHRMMANLNPILHQPKSPANVGRQGLASAHVRMCACAHVRSGVLFHVKTVQVHHLGPGGHKVAGELGCAVVLRVHLGQCAQL